MTYLITGGSGFIGTHLGLALQRAGKPFHILDKAPSHTFPNYIKYIDIQNAEELARAVSGTTIFHLAAEHREDVKPVARYHRVNVDGTRNLCRAASVNGVNRIVFTSSVAVYGLAKGDTDEFGLIKPNTPYGSSKFAAEEILRAWANEAPQTRSLTIVRPTVVFGPGNRGNVYNLFRQIACGRFIMVGDGSNQKSLAYIDNLVEFLLHSAKLGPGVHLFNYVDTPNLEMRQLISLSRKILLGKSGIGPRIPIAVGMALGHCADAFATVSGRRLPIGAGRVKKFITNSTYSTQVHTLNGFHARVSLQHGIRTTLEAEFINPQPRPKFFTQ